MNHTNFVRGLRQILTRVVTTVPHYAMRTFVCLMSCIACSMSDKGAPALSPSVPTTITLEKCAGCIFGAVKYVKQGSAPESVTVAVVGDTAVDYLLDADDNASAGANESIVVDGSSVLVPRVVISGSRHAKVNVRLTPRSSVTFRLRGASQSSITVFVSSAKQAVSADGGIVRGGGTGATVVVPSGTVLSGGIVIGLVDTSGVKSDYPALSDRAYSFSAVPEPNSQFDSTKALAG